MELNLFPEHKDYSGQKVLLGLSGGINSMAVLCWLAEGPKEFYPEELHLFYSHLEEHSPDTYAFVKAGVRYARKTFKNVRFRMVRHSVIRFFYESKMIPHPTRSPCTKYLKLMPMEKYMKENGITENIVGYVKDEVKRRGGRMAKRLKTDITTIRKKGVTISFPISQYSNEWCFSIVKNHIGFYPVIYDIRKRGKRVFLHNNCMPCKNISIDHMEDIKEYYPGYWNKAMKLARDLQNFWGWDADEFYTKFGREDYEKDYKDQPCETCAWD